METPDNGKTEAQFSSPVPGTDKEAEPKNDLNVTIRHESLAYDPFKYVIARMKVVDEDEVPVHANLYEVIRTDESAEADDESIKIRAYDEYIRSHRDFSPGLIEQFYEESSEYYRHALELIPVMKYYVPDEKITIAAEDGGDKLGDIEIDNFVQTLTDEQLHAVTAAVDFLYQFFGSKVYELLKEIVIAPLDDENKLFDPKASLGYAGKDFPGIIFLSHEVCGAPNAVDASGRFESKDGGTNLLPITIIHEFAHLLHFEADKVTPEALLAFSKAVGWEIGAMPAYPKKGEVTAGYKGRDPRSSSPTEYGKSHPFETFAETTSELATSERLASEMSGTRDAWLEYLDKIGQPAPYTSINRPTYECTVERNHEEYHAKPLPDTIYVVRSNG